MEKVTKERLSRFRQEVSRIIEKLKELSMKAGHEDPLFHGTPAEFYKRCGKPTCRCREGGESRHGPYRAIQIWVDGKQKQVTLRKEETHYYEMAKHYQYQQDNRAQIVEKQKELVRLVDEMLEARTIWKKK